MPDKNKIHIPFAERFHKGILNNYSKSAFNAAKNYKKRGVGLTPLHINPGKIKTIQLPKSNGLIDDIFHDAIGLTYNSLVAAPNFLMHPFTDFQFPTIESRVFTRLPKKVQKFLYNDEPDPYTQSGTPFIPGIKGVPNSNIIKSPTAYQIRNLPGYQLKSLMRGNPLERQLSKAGTISRNSIEALAKKGSNVEQSVINEVLNGEFNGIKNIDYNTFRNAIQNKLIKYNRIPNEKWQNYGIDRLGFKGYDIKGNPYRMLDALIENYPERFEKGILGLKDLKLNKIFRNVDDIYGNEEYIKLVDEINKRNSPTLNTFTFESPLIPEGNAKHYDAGTLGHSRTYTTRNEPNILHVIESQSDWGQNTLRDIDPYKYAPFLRWYKDIKLQKNHKINTIRRILGKKYPEFTEDFVKGIEEHGPIYSGNELFDYAGGKYDTGLNSPFEHYMLNDDNYFKINYTPKSEVLNRYYKNHPYIPENYNQIKYLHDNYPQRQIQENLRFAAENNQNLMRYPTPETAAKVEGYPKLFNSSTGEYYYDNKYQTILKRYSDFPKQFHKLYKDADVRTVNDNLGNSWYEVDVPKDYINQEWQYKYGGQMKSKFNRPRAFWGALIGSVIGAGASLINGHKQKKAQERALYNQRSEENRQNEMQAANNMIGLLNNNAIENEYDDKLEFKYGGRKHCDFGSEINDITSPALNALTSIAINSNTNNNDARFNIPQTFYDRNYTKMIYNKFNKAKYGCFKARH